MRNRSSIRFSIIGGSFCQAAELGKKLFENEARDDDLPTLERTADRGKCAKGGSTRLGNSLTCFNEIGQCFS